MYEFNRKYDSRVLVQKNQSNIFTFFCQYAIRESNDYSMFTSEQKYSPLTTKIKLLLHFNFVNFVTETESLFIQHLL